VDGKCTIRRSPASDEVEQGAVDSDLFVIGQFVHGSGSLGHFAAVKMLKSIRHLSERGLLMASQDTVLSVLADFNYVSAIARSSPDLRCGFIVPAFDFRWSTIGRRHV
jgi:hypothetical protein